MKRRDFIAGLGATVAVPRVTRAQQAAKLPIIGFLGAASPEMANPWVAAFVRRSHIFLTDGLLFTMQLVLHLAGAIGG